ncbi:MAG TPA: sensor histidine kinase [Spirochaetia bacterium]|nr:sensor histidine kinase [Spirochaetia bacterium]
MEIDVQLKLADDQAHRVELHSFVNVINIISGELQLIERLLGTHGLFPESLRASQLLVDSFSKPVLARRRAREIGRYRQTVIDELNRATKRAGFQDPTLAGELDRIVALLHNVLRIADIRVQELLARHRAPDRWERVPTEQIRDALVDMLEVIAERARNRFIIVYGGRNETIDSENQYRVEIAVEGDSDGTLPIPPILVDSLRDLVANSRKYTPIGGQISVRLCHDGAEILLCVSDTGRGIPADQIASVVEYGIRGRNTSPAETQGGGFGLTKAYLVCKQFGGRMWIDSELDCGTTITVRIPIPADEEK